MKSDSIDSNRSKSKTRNPLLTQFTTKMMTTMPKGDSKRSLLKEDSKQSLSVKSEKKNEVSEVEEFKVQEPSID